MSELLTDWERVATDAVKQTRAFCDLLDTVIERAEAYEDVLKHIVQWSDAYPLSVFPEPDLKKARELLEAGGITLDAVSAHCMRHVIESVGKMARQALGDRA